MPHNVFDDDSVRKIAADHERLKNQVRNLASTVSARRKSGDTPGNWGRLLRTGITTTNTTYPTYPTSGNTFVVQLEAWTFTEVPGDQTISYRTWEQYIIGHTEDGGYLAEDTHVIISKQQGDETHGRRYWIRPTSAIGLQASRIISSGTSNDYNCVQAETGTVTYTATPGRRAMTFTADSPQALITVYEMNGPPPEAGDVVFTASINGRNYIIRTTGKSRLKATVTQSGGIAANASGEVRIWQNGLATSRYEIAWANWMVTSSIAQNKKVIVEWFDDEAKWIIVSAEC